MLLNLDQMKGLLLLCGHDAYHDFFQSKSNVHWATSLQKGALKTKKKKTKKRINAKKRKVGGARTAKNAAASRAVKVKKSVKAKADKLKIKDRTQKKRARLSYNAVNKEDNKSDYCDIHEYILYLQDDLNELKENLDIYDWFSKNLNYRHIICNSNQSDINMVGRSWIIPTEDDLQGPIEERSQLINIHSSLNNQLSKNKGDLKAIESIIEGMHFIRSPEPRRPPPRKKKTRGGGRVRKPSQSYLKKMKLIDETKEEQWTEIRKWDESVINYLQGSGVRTAMNTELASRYKLQTYHDYILREGLPGSQEAAQNKQTESYFMDKEHVRINTRNIDYSNFRKKYKSFNIKNFIKTNWLNIDHNINPDTRKAWVKFEQTRSGPILTNMESNVLYQLGDKLMKLWCNLIYPNPQTLPTTENDGLNIRDQYNEMMSNTQSDAKLLRKYIVGGLISTDTATKLLNITKEAYDSKKGGAVVNNMAPLSAYSKGAGRGIELFDNGKQYNCVGPSVMDPQTICRNIETRKEENTLGIISESMSIKMYYKMDKTMGGKLNFQIKFPERALLIETHPIKLDKKMPSKTLAISAVIEQMVNKLRQNKTLEDCVNNKEDLIEYVMKPCLAKLCGDFSQELFAVNNIVNGRPTVFVANDGPSAVRFMYMIKCLIRNNKIKPSTHYWGGYLTSNNHKLISSLS